MGDISEGRHVEQIAYDREGRLTFLTSQHDPEVCRLDERGSKPRTLPRLIGKGPWRFSSTDDRWVEAPGTEVAKSIFAHVDQEGALELSGLKGPLARLVSLDHGQNWLVTSTQGLFDGSPDAQRILRWQIRDKMFRVDQFFETGYRPGLLKDLLSSKELGAGPLSQKIDPPDIEILDPAPGSVVGGRETLVRLKVTQRGAGVSGAKLFINGHPLDVQPMVSLNSRGSEEAQVVTVKAELQAGVNELRATAFDSKGEVESCGDRLHLRCEAAPPRPPKLWLVCVGVDQGSVGARLSYAQADATALAGAIRSKAPEVVQSEVLTGETGSKANLIATLDRMALNSQNQDTLLLFLAGHGIADSKGYSFVLSGTDRLTSSELAQQMEKFPAQRQLVILDTCHSAAATPDIAARFAVSQQRMARGSGVFLLAACGPAETTVETSELKHGLLTYSLLEAIRGQIPASDSAKRLTVNFLLRYVSSETALLSERFGSQQEVYQYSNGSDFAIFPGTLRL